MDAIQDLEEELREASCVGDTESLKTLVEVKHVNVNSQNKINGWTALHWGAKRNHAAVVSYLTEHGADKTVLNKDGCQASQLTSNKDILKILGIDPETVETKHSSLPITASYLSHPEFPHSRKNDVAFQQREPTHSFTHPATSRVPDNEVVFKARIANSDEKDFIEVELNRDMLTFDALFKLLCSELRVDGKLVCKVRKLPDTIVRKDKDVRRLTDMQELELVLSNKAISASSRNYNFCPNIKSEQILY
ncbi:ankyrin repeat domain-containing protein 40-like [Gigantopelta aegis]|uniref:ankyrin repeat domain-containing protein 40-like n=1 Tax=Gigantopelta aegis TaxID=1735272 RepID=UPI001B88B0FD|nr:ankyrin repeat domain-containing protein 40-like [Gigantopelta aegis]